MWRTIQSNFRGSALRLFSSGGANHFDLVVLGSGPAAQKAAINAGTQVLQLVLNRARRKIVHMLIGLYQFLS
jgi:hypothetical protein